MNSGSICTFEKSIGSGVTSALASSAGAAASGAFCAASAAFLSESSGFMVGKSSTSRIVALSVISITMRSSPKPRPPVGGIPYSSAFTKSSSTSALIPCASRASTCASKRRRWSIGSFSSVKALPISWPVMKNSKRSVSAGLDGLRLASGEISTG